MSNNAISEEDYEKFCKFLEEHSGIILGQNKQYLVNSRLAPLVDKNDVKDITELLKIVLDPSQKKLRADVVDVMTTNETLWFRDSYPYEILKEVFIPEFQSLNRPIRIWSSACSSGQEPYSISMIVHEYKKSNPSQLSQGVNVLATDLSPTMLDSARDGKYDSLALARGLSDERKGVFFNDMGDGVFQVKDDLKKMVEFKSQNLQESYSLLGNFDIIFCRNVLIYFSPEAKAEILKKFAGALNDKGYLFLGASESLAGLSDEFEMIRSSYGIYYQKK
jgi:chemotaxis protein methyltransferase CheR